MGTKWSHVLKLLLSPPRAAFLYREKPGLCLWLLWLHGTACREDELGSQSHILKMRWLIREKLLAISLSRSSCPVLFFVLFCFSLDLIVTPFPFKRVLPLFVALYVYPHIKSEDTLNKLVLSFYLVGPGDGPWVTSFGNRCPYPSGHLTASNLFPRRKLT